MTYLPTLHAYLHQSSLLIQAYPTTRITTKYSLPRKSKASKAKSKPEAQPTSDATQADSKAKREPAATLTLKTFHPESGICLKYQTDKAAEVGRLMNGLGRLAKGEVIELPTAATTNNPAVGAGELLSTDRMEVDTGAETKEKVVVPPQTALQMTAGGGGGAPAKGKKKKGGKK